jgi:hypothetical protein
LTRDPALLNVYRHEREEVAMASPFARDKAVATAKRLGRITIDDLMEMYGVSRTHIYEYLQSHGIKPGPTNVYSCERGDPILAKIMEALDY